MGIKGAAYKKSRRSSLKLRTSVTIFPLAFVYSNSFSSRRNNGLIGVFSWMRFTASSINSEHVTIVKFSG